MSRHQTARRNLAASSTIGVIALAVVVFPLAFGQTAAVPGGADVQAANALLPDARYEVATIKLSKPGNWGKARTQVNGEFLSSEMTIRATVCMIYRKFDFQIVGGPAWFASDRYDIEAKPDNALEERIQKLNVLQRGDLVNRMLQELLADRLKLKVHRETRQLPIFALVVSKGGPKMEEAKPGNAYSLTVSNGRLIAKAISMDKLADQLTAMTHHVVANRTGLQGIYDFTLQYANDVASPEDVPSAAESSPSIYTALQEQLGLKAESTKGPAEVLVIDHVERPSEN